MAYPPLKKYKIYGTKNHQITVTLQDERKGSHREGENIHHRLLQDAALLDQILAFHGIANTLHPPDNIGSQTSEGLFMLYKHPRGWF